VKNEATAQDLCQETFLRWFNLPHPQNIAVPRAWLKKVLSNLAWNHMRHLKIRFKREIAFWDNNRQESTNMNPDLTRIEVEDILASLPWKDQLLLKMKMDGLSYSEMAEAANVSIGSVGTMLRRAMHRFKTAYAGKEVNQTYELSRPRPTLTVFREGTDH
jgi:RNA polymerase sigma factor (sigma-70 family)